MPMTRLVDELLREAPQGTRGWRLAEAETAAVQHPAGGEDRKAA